MNNGRNRRGRREGGRREVSVAVGPGFKGVGGSEKGVAVSEPETMEFTDLGCGQ